MISKWNFLPSHSNDVTPASNRSIEELAVEFVNGEFVTGSSGRVLILPALFDEANKLRRQTLLIMRALNELSIDSVLPDLPGMNESLVPISDQSITKWRAAAVAAATHFKVTHILAIRGGALIAPSHLPGWHYAPTNGARILRNMLRAKMLADRETGQGSKTEQCMSELSEQACKEGITLAGWSMNAKMFAELQEATPELSDNQTQIEQGYLGGAGLWLRAEAGESPDQASAIAEIIAKSMAPA